jgi:hypothetical protein
MTKRLSRSAYAAARGVDPNVITKAIAAGTVFLHPDGGVDVEASDAVWGARRVARFRAGAQMTEIQERRRQAELEYLQATITLEKQKYQEGLARLVDRREMQAEIDAVVAALLDELDHLGEDDASGRACRKSASTRRLILPI